MPVTGCEGNEDVPIYHPRLYGQTRPAACPGKKCVFFLCQVNSLCNFWKIYAFFSLLNPWHQYKCGDNIISQFLVYVIQGGDLWNDSSFLVKINRCHSGKLELWGVISWSTTGKSCTFVPIATIIQSSWESENSYVDSHWRETPLL